MVKRERGEANVADTHEETRNTARTEKLAALGYPPDARLLIINGDDLGMCHAGNAATFDAMEHGVMTAASLMLPCPWAFHAVQHLRDVPTLDVGVHLTLTAEWPSYRWGPLLGAARCPSLVDQDGFFYHDHVLVHERADLAEARAEVEAQMERAYALGLDPTNIDGHMGTFSADRRFLDLEVEMARRYRLPLRVHPGRRPERAGAEAPTPLDLTGLMTVDDRLGIALRDPAALQQQLLADLRTLRPGVTELGLHAALPTPEAQASMRDWEARAEAYRLVRDDDEVRQLIDDLGIVLIGWRQLREAQRARAE
jgi:chitin disaccharide deacetylase